MLHCRNIFNIHLSFTMGLKMSRDQVVGAGILFISAVIIIAYLYLVFLTEFSLLLLQITAAVAVVGVFGILGWIGYTLATTPPPKPIEEIEKEIEEETKKIEEEEKKAKETEK
jgi:predicted DNA-binding transcriptional regulator